MGSANKESHAQTSNQVSDTAHGSEMDRRIAAVQNRVGLRAWGSLMWYWLTEYIWRRRFWNSSSRSAVRKEKQGI